MPNKSHLLKRVLTRPLIIFSKLKNWKIAGNYWIHPLFFLKLLLPNKTQKETIFLCHLGFNLNISTLPSFVLLKQNKPKILMVKEPNLKKLSGILIIMRNLSLNVDSQ
jgi:hypothetical protein